MSCNEHEIINCPECDSLIGFDTYFYAYICNKCGYMRELRRPVYREWDREEIKDLIREVIAEELKNENTRNGR